MDLETDLATSLLNSSSHLSTGIYGASQQISTISKFIKYLSNIYEESSSILKCHFRIILKAVLLMN